MSTMPDPVDTCDVKIDGCVIDREAMRISVRLRKEAEHAPTLRYLLEYMPAEFLEEMLGRWREGGSKVPCDQWRGKFIPKAGGDEYRHKIISHAIQHLRGQWDLDTLTLEGHAIAIACDAVMAWRSDEIKKKAHT